MQSGGQGHRLVADNENVAASFKSAALPEMFDLAAHVPNWSVSDDYARYGYLLNARRMARMFPDGWSTMIVDCRGIRHNTNFGALERHRSLLRRC